MSRIPMVTRTITSTIFEVMTVDVTNGSVNITNFTLSGEHEVSDKTLKALKKDFETDTIKLVNIESAKCDTKLYGMTEHEFIEHARILPNR